MKTMTFKITHYARPVLDMTYVHEYHTIMSVCKHRVAGSMFTLVLKFICSTRRRTLGWDQPNHRPTPNIYHVPKKERLIIAAKWT